MFDENEDNSDIQDSGDFLGGSRTLDTGVFDFVIDMAYYDKSTGGAGSLTLSLKSKEGVELKQTLWIKSGNKKGNKIFYVDKKNNKRYLPGFEIADAIALLSVKKSILKVVPEIKTVMVYDFDEKKELPTQKEVLVELIGAEICLGVTKQIVDKNVDDGNGEWVPSGVTRTENEIQKVFRMKDGMTVTEIRAKATESVFKAKWLEKNEGNVIDKTVAQKGEQTAPVDSAAAGSTDTSTSDEDDMFG